MSRFNRYQGMFVEPAFKSVDVYNSSFDKLKSANEKSTLLRQAKVAIAWGEPDNESIGMSQRELISLISRLVKYIEQV